ncbi:MAG: DUF1028 domain-containing protein [Alphaproteobacteria bacterium]|nr:DUF1028 domain-containing protein [Alphaproteobacteria bacterium]
MTFSVTGRCTRTGAFGIAISTSSIAVASRCVWGRAGVGAVATQNITNPLIGAWGLDSMAGGKSAKDALDAAMAREKFPDYRQVAMLGKSGPGAFYEGKGTLGTHCGHVGKDSVGIGNLLANTNIAKAMSDGFEKNPELHIAERLMRGLEAGLAAGGELDQVRSAGLFVVTEPAWPICDLRVDWSDDPIGDLRRNWTAFEPQMMMYVTRALNPPAAKSYGVKGDP